MANTIKFGNGQWATKEDSILAYNDENANFKPLPFVTSRASTATTVNKSGLLETVASGVPRVDYLDNSKGSYLIEPSSTNLIIQSEAFGNGFWNKEGSTIEGDASTAGSDVLSGFNFTNWSTIGGASIVDSDTFNSTSSGGIRKDGLITSGKTYLITIAGTTDATGFTFQNYGLGITYKTIPSGAFNETFYIEAEDAGFYLRNNGAYTTNVTTFSVKEVQGFSAPSVDSPLGAFKLVEDTSNGKHLIQSSSYSYVSGNSYSISIYAKKDGVDRLYFSNSGLGGSVFNLDNGSVVSIGGNNAYFTNHTAKVESLDNGWFRLSVSKDCVQNINGSSRFYLGSGSSSYQGDGTSGVYIFASQLEQNSYATSYIPTKGSQISRLSESASQTLSDGIIGQTEGTLYWEGKFYKTSILMQIAPSIGGNYTKSLYMEYVQSSNKIIIQVWDNGVKQAELTYTAVNVGTTYKIALAYKQNDINVFVNGSSIGTSTSSTIQSGLNKLFIGHLIGYSTDNTYIGSSVNCAKLYNTRLSNSELQTLTTI